jgi:hemerythrin-like domain-containing protein
MLLAEHSVLRQTLSTMTDIVRDQDWHRHGWQIARLATLVEFLHEFETMHRAKEDDFLWPALRGRCALVDSGLSALALARRQGDDRLGDIRRTLAAVADGGPAAAHALDAALRRYRETALSTCDEEARLLEPARRLLDETQWPAIASALSKFAYPRGALYEKARLSRHEQQPIVVH